MNDNRKDFTSIFFDFLRFCLKEDTKEPQNLSEMDWDALYDFGRKQAILGVLFHGIKRLSKSEYRPDRRQILRWYADCSFIEKANIQTYKDASDLTEMMLKKFGVHSCVLKGQTNALMYPDPYMRTSGDIDLWTDAKTLDIIRISRQLDPKGEIGYHHIELSYFKTPVELHFFPSFMGNMWHEYKLRRFFNQCKEAQFDRLSILPSGLGEIYTLTDDFNRVFQMSHLMHHFFFEGIGLRQMIDYYYLLLRGFTDEERKKTIRVFKQVGMFKFAAAVMYIMKDILGLPDQYLLMKPNERVGKILVSEIIQSGNFGFHDKRYSFTGKSVYSQYFLEIYRNLHFAFDFPSETIWGRPVSRWWHMLYKAYLCHQLRKYER
ncbi:nucleotidyltransferase family protein [Prevotella veroralis]|uniref:nucleotidyltransferase family protein n=1 Tax=Prevotella veroralis TaxID=28137 RepID=UPI0003647001|nr:nucleotidyltransferase family protein [Prevotella veroralis]